MALLCASVFRVGEIPVVAFLPMTYPGVVPRVEVGRGPDLGAVWYVPNKMESEGPR